jgi:fatty-acyl-CoA synthase
MNPAVDVGRWIRTQAECRPDKVALRFEDTVLTYREFSERCAALAVLLSIELDLGPGARVAYLGVNLPDTLALFFACAMTRLIFVPLNWRLAARELDSILADCTPGALFIEDSCAELAISFNYPPPR